MRNIIINELLKSNAFTRKQLEEAPKERSSFLLRTRIYLLIYGSKSENLNI